MMTSEKLFEIALAKAGSADKLAKACGVSHSSISRWKHGTTRINIDSRRKLYNYVYDYQNNTEQSQQTENETAENALDVIATALQGIRDSYVVVSKHCFWLDFMIFCSLIMNAVAVGVILSR